MDLACQHLLARAVLTCYEDVGIGHRHLFHHHAQLAHGVALAPHHVSCLRRGLSVMTLGLVFVACGTQRVEHALVVERLHDKVGSPFFYSSHRKVYVGVCREQHHLRLRTAAFGLAKPKQALTTVVDATAKIHVEQHHVGLHLAQPCRQGGGGGYGFDRSKLCLCQHLNGCQYGAVVVNDE